MTTETKTPWKKLFDYRFLSAEELPGEIKVKIKAETPTPKNSMAIMARF
jgi:hypothetical protein